MSADTGMKRIAEIVMRTIPYPMVLVFRIDDKVQIWTAHQRINQSDKTRNTLDDFIFTGWLSLDDTLFNCLDIRKMRFTNYFTLYIDMVDAISVYNAGGLVGNAVDFSGEKARRLMSKVDALDQEMANLRNQLKKESQFNRKMELNIKIKQLESTKHKLLQGGLTE